MKAPLCHFPFVVRRENVGELRYDTQVSQEKPKSLLIFPFGTQP